MTADMASLRLIAGLGAGIGIVLLVGHPWSIANNAQNTRLDRIEHQLRTRATTTTTLSPDLNEHPPACVFDDATCAGIARAVKGLDASCGHGYVVSVELKGDGTREVTGHCFK